MPANLNPRAPYAIAGSDLYRQIRRWVLDHGIRPHPSLITDLIVLRTQYIKEGQRQAADGFLDLWSDSSHEETVDGETLADIQYRIKCNGHNLAEVLRAFGIERRENETPGDALDRRYEEDCIAIRNTTATGNAITGSTDCTGGAGIPNCTQNQVLAAVTGGGAAEQTRTPEGIVLQPGQVLVIAHPDAGDVVHTNRNDMSVVIPVCGELDDGA